MRVSDALFVLALSGSALAVGTVHTVTLCMVTAVLCAAVACAWWGSDPIRVRPVATLLVLTAVSLTGFTLLQCIPLPLWLLGWVSPNAADVWSRVLAPLRQPGPAWASTSLDPVATRIEVLKGVAYILALVKAIKTTRTRDGVGLLGAVVVVIGLVLAVAALLHPAFGAMRLFGIYEPTPSIAERHIAPLLNPNHLAGYLNLAICLTIASAISPNPRVPPVLSAAATVFLVAVQVWNGSRAGVASMVVGGILVLTLAKSARSERGSSLSAALSTTAILAGAAVVGISSAEDTDSHLLSTDVSKFRIATRAFRVTWAHPIFGVGRGAFESAFPRFRDGAGYVTYTHPENVLAQWSSEWGIPVSLLAAVSLAIALRPRSALARSTTAAGAWAGLAALGVQNLSDFSLEVPGVMLAAIVCSAIVVGGSAGATPRYRLERWSARSNAVAGACVVGAFASCILALPCIGHELYRDRTALHAAAVQGAMPRSQFEPLVRAAMVRHPAEPYLPFAGAVRAVRVGDESPLPWLGATLERANVYAPAHVLLARVVAPRSRSQARSEYRTALEQEPELFGEVVHELSQLAGSYDDANELIPAGKLGPAVRAILAQETGGRLPATRIRLDRDIIATDPANAMPWDRLAYDWLADLRLGDASPWCAGSLRGTCLDTVLSLASKMEELEPRSCSPPIVRARALVEAGNPQAAMDGLESLADSRSDRFVCLEVVVEIAERFNDRERGEAALRKIKHSPCSDDASCALALQFAADAFEKFGDPRQALATYERAYGYAPADETIQRAMARLAGSTGEHAKAAEYYDALARRHPDDPIWSRAASAERDTAMRAVAPF